MRDIINLVLEADDLLAGEPLGTIVSIQPDEMFGATVFAIKMANGAWHKVIFLGPNRGVDEYKYEGTPIDAGMLMSALRTKRLSRSMKGIQPSDRIGTSVQVNALPVGALVMNPSTGSRYHRTEHGMVSSDGKALPDAVFRHDNAQWQE